MLVSTHKIGYSIQTLAFVALFSGSGFFFSEGRRFTVAQDNARSSEDKVQRVIFRGQQKMMKYNGNSIKDNRKRKKKENARDLAGS